MPKIEFQDVKLAFGEKIVLDGVSFGVEPGEMKVILGQSGTGKSTILRLILGLLKPDSGQIFINGEEIGRLSEEELNRIRQKMSIVFQEGALFDSLTVYENIAYRPRELSWPEEKIERRVQEVMEFADLGDVADLLPGSLSGGTQRLVAIARAIVDNPEIILFDEPTVGLDPPTARRLCEAAVRLRDLSNVTSMFVTHRLADSISYLLHRQSFNNPDMEEGTMKVQDVMTSEVKSCRPETNLAEAAAMMLEYDCGALPVVDNENKVIGMITDRDIAIAAATGATSS